MRETYQETWMSLDHMPAVMEIEQSSFDWPWKVNDFKKCSVVNNCKSVVVTNHADRVVGYTVFELNDTQIDIINLAIHPTFRRQGLASGFVNQMIKQVKKHKRRHSITLEVRERNLAAQLFLRSLGFRAEVIMRQYYEETDEDAYLMVHDKRRR